MGNESKEFKLELERAKGTRDFPPEEMIVRQQVLDTLRTNFELFGFNPLETPIFERFDVLASKYAGGAEILKETFKMKDQGNRDLGLRYDLTVPTSRFVGMNPSLKMPFKRYQMGPVFRDGPIKLGRYREFWQCDVDTFGSKNMLADAECIMLAQSVFKKLNLDVVIEVSNRKVLDGILTYCEIPEEKRVEVITAIDKLKKINIKDVEKELQEKGIPSELIDRLFRVLKTTATNEEKIAKLKQLFPPGSACEGLKEMQDLLSSLDDQSNVVFELGLARGLAYYTGTVFEGFLRNPKEDDVKSSLCGGGRYDKMVGNFLQSNKEVPAVGLSFGIEPITEQMKINKQRSGDGRVQKSVAQVFIIPIQTVPFCLQVAGILRKDGINTEMDLMDRGITKNLNYANVLNIPFVLIAGTEEVQKNRLKLKNMKSGEEQMLTLAEVVAILKEKR